MKKKANAKDFFSKHLKDCPFNLQLSRQFSKSKSAYVFVAMDEPDDLEELVRMAWEDEDLVDAVTGKTFVKPKVVLEDSSQPEIEELRKALNDQEIDYDRFKAKLDEAFEEAVKLPLRKRIHQIGILRQLKADLKPSYSAKSRTMRLYAIGPSVQNLKRELREILFKGQIQLDLAHCQFSVVAKLWDIPLLLEYVDDLWLTLTSETGVGDKGILKELLYAAAYGRDRDKAFRELERAGVSSDQANALLAHPVISKLFFGSQEELEQIAAGETYVDAYGNELSAKAIGKRLEDEGMKRKSDIDKKSCRSVLSSQAQSYELRLLAEATLYLIRHGVEILAWLHDGIIVDGEADPSLFEEAIKIVERTASELGIKTRLEIELINPEGSSGADDLAA